MSKSTNNLRRLAGQLFIVGFEGVEADGKLLQRMEEWQPGGIILFARNIVTAAQCHHLTSELRHAPEVDPFMCVDLEGGTVDRFKSVLAASPSAEEVYATKVQKMYEMHGSLLGCLAFSLGFNTDFAPVSDIGFSASKKVLGSRTVSPFPDETVIYVRKFLRGLSLKVLGCGKHFPGLGEGTLDSHHELPVINKSWEKLWKEDLLPYRVLRRQFHFVMVAHAAYSAVTGTRTPASLSSHWMDKVLRKQIDYSGIILADDLEMGGVLTAGSVGEVAVESLRAGADMCLVCHKESAVESALETVIREAEKDPEFRMQVEVKARHVAGCKKRWPQMKHQQKSFSTNKADQLHAAIAKFSDKLKRATKKSVKP